MKGSRVVVLKDKQEATGSSPGDLRLILYEPKTPPTNAIDLPYSCYVACGAPNGRSPVRRQKDTRVMKALSLKLSVTTTLKIQKHSRATSAG